jgi:hypothetical protein
MSIPPPGAAWWWYPLIDHPDGGRGMRVPTRSDLEALAELEKELGGDDDARKLLRSAARIFMHSRDEEVLEYDEERTTRAGKRYSVHHEDPAAKPWAGVGSMWALFISQAPVWIEKARDDIK